MSTALRSVTNLLIGIAIFVGLPLAGWGIMDAQGFVGHPARLGYVVLAVLLQLLVAVMTPSVGSHRGEGERSYGASDWLCSSCRYCPWRS